MNFQKSFIVRVSQIKIASVVLPKYPLITSNMGHLFVVEEFVVVSHFPLTAAWPGQEANG